jgi:hypothetical protein
MIATMLLRSSRQRRRAVIALIASAIAKSAYAFPADGDVDPGFGDSYVGYTIVDFGTGGDGHQDGAHRLLRQPDGKFVAVGSVDSAYGHGHQAIGLTRILNNGHLDSSFGVGGTGKFILNPAAGEDFTGNGITQLSDGQFVVAGTYSHPVPFGLLVAFAGDGSTFSWTSEGQSGSAFNDVFALADGRLLVGAAAPGINTPATNDFALLLFDSAGSFIEQLWMPFDLGGSNNDVIQRITFVPAVDTASHRLGYVYAIGSVALPNYASGHANIECGIIKVGLYSSGSKLQPENSFGSSGKVVLDVNAVWSAGHSGTSDVNAYCRGLSVGKDGSLLIAGERYYFDINNDHATADDSMGFAVKLNANGATDPAFDSSGFRFFLNGVFASSGLYEGFWFSLIQANGRPILGGLLATVCPGYAQNRSWVLRASVSGLPDAAYRRTCAMRHDHRQTLVSTSRWTELWMPAERSRSAMCSAVTTRRARRISSSCSIKAISSLPTILIRVIERAPRLAVQSATHLSSHDSRAVQAGRIQPQNCMLTIERTP